MQDSEKADFAMWSSLCNSEGEVMGLLLFIILVFLLLGGAGFGLHGTLGTVLIVLAIFWLLGGVGFHGSRYGWYRSDRQL